MKRNMFFAFLLFSVCFLIMTDKLYSTNVIYECHRQTHDHDWWNPFHWFTDYNEVYRYVEGGWVGRTLVIMEYTNCIGLGDRSCPSCGSALTISKDDDVLDQEFLDNSTSMMEADIINEVSLGNFSGYKTYNTFYNNQSVYRNATWEADTISSRLEYKFVIMPIK